MSGGTRFVKYYAAIDYQLKVTCLRNMIMDVVIRLLMVITV